MATIRHTPTTTRRPSSRSMRYTDRSVLALVFAPRMTHGDAVMWDKGARADALRNAASAFLLAAIALWAIACCAAIYAMAVEQHALSLRPRFQFDESVGDRIAVLSAAFGALVAFALSAIPLRSFGVLRNTPARVFDCVAIVSGAGVVTRLFFMAATASIIVLLSKVAVWAPAHALVAILDRLALAG